MSKTDTDNKSEKKTVETLTERVEDLGKAMQALRQMVRHNCQHESWFITRNDNPPIIAGQTYLCHKQKILPVLQVTCYNCGRVDAYAHYALPQKYRRVAKANGLFKDRQQPIGQVVVVEADGSSRTSATGRPLV